MTKIYFDIGRYPFKELVSDWFKCEDLSNLHTIKNYKHFTRKNDQSTMWHGIFYKKIKEGVSFNQLYERFLKEVIKPRFGEEVVYQKIPTFRVHLPNNVAVGEFHKDKHYRDEGWALKVKETNYYLPLTRAYETNTIWSETKEDKKDFKPMEGVYGDIYEWEASNLTHGNKDNTTPDTRVSFDFRVIPASRYIDSDHLTINTKIPFNIGGYYDTI